MKRSLNPEGWYRPLFSDDRYRRILDSGLASSRGLCLDGPWEEGADLGVLVPSYAARH